MAIERDDFIEVLKDAYSAYYSLLPGEGAGGLPLSFRAVYRSRDEQFFLVKSASVWANEKNEYAYIFSAPDFDAALALRCIDWAIAETLPQVRPHREHQYSNVKVILVADRLEQETIDAIRKKRFSKSYGFLSLHGYTELIAAGVELGREKTWANPAGNALPQFFGKLFALRREKP